MSERREVASTLEFPYQRSAGDVMGAFFQGLREQRITGIRTPSGDVLVPPLEFDPATGASVDPTPVDVGPGGEVTTWTWVDAPGADHPLDRPFAFALIRLDGATTALTHVVDAGDRARMQTGMRVTASWRAEREARITDIEAFVPEVQA
ncbi:MAG: Zn-ribbon domain-containing OB-fold protein [Acidimicrobiales bacterium]